MRNDVFPSCCVARIISRFGGGHIGQTEHYDKRPLITFLAGRLTVMKNQGVKVVFACPTSTQPNACAAFDQLGFYSHPTGITSGKSRRNHSMYPVFLNLNEWDEKDFWEGYNPDEDTYVDKHSYRDMPTFNNNYF